MQMQKLVEVRLLAVPATAALRKSLRVFISSSSLFVLAGICPEIFREIDDDWFGSASHDYPAKWVLVGRIQLLMGQPTWHMQKVARRDRVVECSPACPQRTDASPSNT